MELRFKRNKNKQIFKKVHVTIRRSEKGPIREKDFLIPKYIDTDELDWKDCEGNHICVYYHRSNSENYYYTDDGGVRIYGPLSHQLEALVKESCLRKKRTTK